MQNCSNAGLFWRFPLHCFRNRSLHFPHAQGKPRDRLRRAQGARRLAKLQRAGRNLDTISLDILVAPAGAPASVELRLLALQAMSHVKSQLPLIIGLKYYGMYVLKSYEITRRQIHYGVVLAADVNLNLQEYN